MHPQHCRHALGPSLDPFPFAAHFSLPAVLKSLNQQQPQQQQQQPPYMLLSLDNLALLQQQQQLQR